MKIAVGSVALSIAVMLLAVAAGKGMQDKIREKISAFSGHILILPYNNNHSQLTLDPIPIRQDFYLHHSWPGVSNVAPYASIGGLLRNRKDFEGIILKGTGPDYDWSVFRQYMQRGKIPAYTGRGYNDSIIVSEYLARRLAIDTGSKVYAYFLRPRAEKPLVRRFRVGGVYRTDFEDFDKTYIFGDLHQVQRLYGWADTLTGGFQLLTRDFDHIDAIADRINHDIDPRLRALSIRQLYPYLFDWLDMFDFNIYLIIGILILVSALNMAVVLLVMITERMRFIGILKTLGATDRGIIRIFLIRAAQLILRGLLIGNALALALIFLQKKTGFLRLDPANYYVRTVPLEIRWEWFLGLNLFVLASVLALMLLPAAYVSRISPAKVMKYE